MKYEEKIYDIGEWVGTEDGYGQVLYNRNLYYEEFDLATGNYRKGEFKRTIYICKIFCDFDWKVKSRFRIDVYTSINKLDTIKKNKLDKTKLSNQESYKKYIVFESKENITRQVFLEYRIENCNLNKIITGVENIKKLLPLTFTYNEFKRELKKIEISFDVTKFIRYNENKVRSECITIRLDSELYKTKGKEALFRTFRVIKL